MKQFQFLLVRLRPLYCLLPKPANTISIPLGAIKAFFCVKNNFALFEFQFLLVRLRPIAEIRKFALSRISIPLGAIKADKAIKHYKGQ